MLPEKFEQWVQGFQSPFLLGETLVEGLNAKTIARCREYLELVLESWKRMKGVHDD
jgi:hypothetical protein